MNELTTVHLVGSLGKRFGPKWELDVKSPAEAVRAIDINLRGALCNYLRGPARDRYYKIAVQNKRNVIDKTEIAHRSGRSDIYIIPTIRGNNSGVGKIIAGVILTIIAIVTYQEEWLPQIWAGAIAGAGTSLILGGITQLLTPTPHFNNQNSGPQQQSTSFPGNATAVSQGQCIPVVYGHMLIPAVPISISTTNNDVPTTQVGYTPGQRANPLGGNGLGGVDISPLNGGGVQYSPIEPN